jgi:tetratricopeptide (TPR) repeat protein
MYLLLYLALALQPDPAMLRRIFEDALSRREQQLGSADARTAQAARDLGLFLAREGDRPGAQAALAKAVRYDEAVFGPTAGRTLEDVAELAALSAPASAVPLWTRAAAAADDEVAVRALTALGDLRGAAGDRVGAAAFYRRALARQETATGRDSEPVSVRLNALAHVVPPVEGIGLLERALVIDRRALGARHPQTASTEANLAGLLVNAGRHDEAVRDAGEALSIFQETLGPDHPRCAITAMMLATALEAKGQTAQAEKLYRMAVAIDERAYGPRHPQTLADMRTLADFLKAIGKQQEAEALEKKAAGR